MVDPVTPAMIEAACEARNMVPNTHWTDGMTEGVQAIERMLAEKMIRAALPTLLDTLQSQERRIGELEFVVGRVPIGELARIWGCKYGDAAVRAGDLLGLTTGGGHDGHD